MEDMMEVPKLTEEQLKILKEYDGELAKTKIDEDLGKYASYEFERTSQGWAARFKPRSSETLSKGEESIPSVFNRQALETRVNNLTAAGRPCITEQAALAYWPKD